MPPFARVQMPASPPSRLDRVEGGRWNRSSFFSNRYTGSRFRFPVPGV